jgi:hypothetical protein
MFYSSTCSEICVTDDWGFYIDIEAHDWNQIGAAAPMKIQINKVTINNDGGNTPMTKEDIQRHIDLSKPKEEKTRGNDYLNLNALLSKTVTVAIIAALVFY